VKKLSPEGSDLRGNQHLFRWIVMRTSKIPQWPQWVEDECRIEPDDPWVRDGRHRT
jgi:hypothetical protein